MIAKVIAHGDTRSQAVERLSSALGDLKVAGLPNNAIFLGALLQHPVFLKGNLNTNFLSEHKVRAHVSNAGLCSFLSNL